LAKKRYNSRQEKDKEVANPPEKVKTYGDGVQQGIMYGCMIGVAIMYLIMR